MPAELLGLPAEMKLQILSNIPVKDLLATSRVCRHMYDLIRNPANHALLLEPRQTRAIRHLHKTANVLVHYPSQTTFLQALQAFVAHRGIRAVGSPQSRESISHFNAFAAQWLDNHSEAWSPPGFKRAYRFLWMKLARLAFCLGQVHIQRHCPDMPYTSTPEHRRTYFPQSEAEFVSVFQQCSAVVCPGSAVGDSLRELYRAGQDVHGGIFRGCIIQRPALMLDIPERSLTPLTVPIDLQYEGGLLREGVHEAEEVNERLKNLAGICSFDKLHAVLPELPELPLLQAVQRTYFAEFAYCVQSRWAVQLVAEALRGKALGRFEKAALFEEIYLY